MKNILRALLFAGVVLAQMSPAYADDSDIFGRNVQPNVLILLDSSQSMTEQVPSQPYDNTFTYPTINKCGNPATSACDPVKVYKLSSSKYTVYANTVALVTSSSARTALNNVGYWSGSISGTNYQLFLGNYLNWKLSGNYPATEQKIVIAKRVITNLINNVDGVRFGAMKFKTPVLAGGTLDGAEMIDPIGTAKATLINDINSMSLTSVGTVLGEQVYGAGQYFKGLDWHIRVPSPWNVSRTSSSSSRTVNIPELWIHRTEATFALYAGPCQFADRDSERDCPHHWIWSRYRSAFG